jgi:thymidylate kinase
MNMRARKTGRTTFLSFSGIDGAGKSTQICALSASLSRFGLRVRVIPFWDEVACLRWLRENAGHRLFRGDRGIGTPLRPIERRDKNVRGWPMICFRLFLYLLDALSIRGLVGHLRCSEYDVVIFDRHIYDELANLNLHNAVCRAYVRVILKLVPKPDVSYLLDADSAQARARKPEYPIHFVQINRQSYIDLSKIAGTMICVPPMTIESAHQAIVSCALDAISRSDEHGNAIDESKPVESSGTGHRKGRLAS